MISVDLMKCFFNLQMEYDQLNKNGVKETAEIALTAYCGDGVLGFSSVKRKG